jgi:hypothetical protein
MQPALCRLHHRESCLSVRRHRSITSCPGKYKYLFKIQVLVPYKLPLPTAIFVAVSINHLNRFL